jgi:hypothetical protein
MIRRDDVITVDCTCPYCDGSLHVRYRSTSSGRLRTFDYECPYDDCRAAVPRRITLAGELLSVRRRRDHLRRSLCRAPRRRQPVSSFFPSS